MPANYSYPYKIRDHRTKAGNREWHYWSSRYNRWYRYTRRMLSPDEAKTEIAKHCYGVDPDQVVIQ